MKKKLNEKQEAESIFITKWCLTIIDFIYSNNSVNPHLIKLRKQAFSDETKTKYLEQTSPGIYLKGIRQAYSDVNEMAKDAPKQILEELNKILRNKFGKDLSTYSQDISSRIEEILKRGKIIDDDEFKIVEEKVSELCQIDPQLLEVTTFNNLLSVYHELRR
jgi:hypothetical protein